MDSKAEKAQREGKKSIAVFSLASFLNNRKKMHQRENLRHRRKSRRYSLLKEKH
jgi:hypothetical protein